MNVAPGNRVLADDQVQMRSLWWALVQCDWRPYKKVEIWTQAQTSTEGRQRKPTQGEHHVKIGVILPEAKEGLGLSEAGGARKAPSPAGFRGVEFC